MPLLFSDMLPLLLRKSTAAGSLQEQTHHFRRALLAAGSTLLEALNASLASWWLFRTGQPVRTARVRCSRSCR